MGFQWVRVGFLFFSALVFSSRSFAPDLSYSSALGVGAVAISSMKGLLSRGGASVYPQEKRFCCTDDSSARVPLPPDKNNLHVISLPPEAMKAADVNLPALPDGRKPENVKGAVVSRTPGLKGEITLKFFPGSRAASFDWSNEEGELSREYVLLREKDEGALDEDEPERLSVSGGAFNNDLWEVYSWEVHHGDSNNDHKTEDQEWLKKSAAAMQATFEKILDMIYGDSVQIYFPEQSIYSPGPGDHGLAVAVVYFRPGYFLSYGPSETHLQNWLEVLGGYGLSGGSGSVKERKKRKRSSLDSDSDLELEPREKIAREVIDELEKMGDEQALFVKKVKEDGKDFVSVFSLAHMPEGFASPVLHWVFQELLAELGELEEGMAFSEILWALQRQDPLLFDTFSFLVSLAMEPGGWFDEESLYYVKQWVRYFELYFEQKINWQDHSEHLDLSRELKLFSGLNNDERLPVRKPEEISSNVGWNALKLFKKDLKEETRYWTELRGVMQKQEENFKRVPLSHRWIQNYKQGSKQKYGLTLEGMEAKVSSEKYHADPLFIPFIRFVFRSYLEKNSYFVLKERQIFYKFLDSVIGYSSHSKLDWEFWLTSALDVQIRIKRESSPLDSGVDEPESPSP